MGAALWQSIQCESWAYRSQTPARSHRLRTDYIDILQFHGGDAETLQRTGLIDLLCQFREHQRIHFLGSSSSLPDLPGLIALGVFNTFQIPYSCLAPQHGDLIRQPASTGAGILLRGGIAQGGPDAEIQRPALNDVWTRARLDELLQPGMSRAELILRHTLAAAVGTGNGREASDIANWSWRWIRFPGGSNPVLIPGKSRTAMARVCRQRACKAAACRIASERLPEILW
jgi:aryl-alcohol dehydrogenase-like predicted oxidoreductase